MTKLRAACIQMRSTTDPVENIDTFVELVAEAAGQEASYIQSPEMTGLIAQNRKKLFEVAKPQSDDPLVAKASTLAAKHGVWLHVGSTAILRDDGKVANRAFVFAPDGSLQATYDKIHMFDVDLDNGESWRESAVYEPGRNAVMVNIDGIDTGLAICYDMRFPHLFKDYAVAGASLLTAPAAFTRQTGQAHWHALLRARAIENGAFVVAAAQGGLHQDGRETFGHSLIINPWGEIIAEADHDEPAVIVADIDFNEVVAARSKIPNLRNARDYTFVRSNAEPGKVAV